MTPNDPGAFEPGSPRMVLAEEFTRSYYDSLHPEVRAALKTTTETGETITDEDRRATLREIAIRTGALIDVHIMVYLDHPFWTMVARRNLGLTWIPSALQPEGFGGQGPVPPGAIAVIDPNDRSQWPAPFTPPVPPPVQGKDYVGARNPVWDGFGFGLGYNANPDVVRLRDAPTFEDRYMLANGQEHPEDGNVFNFHIVKTMIGESYFFSLKQ